MARLAALFPFPLYPVGIKPFRKQGGRNRGYAYPAPAFFGVFYEFADDQGRENSGHLYPMAGRARADVRVRTLEALPVGLWVGGVILTQLCCARFHFAHRLCLVGNSVKEDLWRKSQ